MERFEREIKLAARLQHPHILGVFDSGAFDGRLWFTMPYIEGESLRGRMSRERQLPVADAVSIAREVADALDYAHRRGVIHRDIKPENILLSGRHAMVADFGISRSMNATEGALTQTGIAIGTPGYMSPEQATGERSIDARTDIYSLGCVLYEMLAGEAPFSGPNAQSVIARMMTETPRSIAAERPGVTEALNAITLRALSRVPADRFATAGEFADALGGAVPTVSGLSPAATGAGPTTTAGAAAGPTTKRRSPLFAVFALGILIGLGGLSALKAHRDDSVGRGLAVLPFENVGAAEDAYFADGITEEVRGKLAGIPGLRVTARTSSNTYKGSKKSPSEIGAELGVEYLLTGTIRWEQGADGQRHVRVTPELIKAADGANTWQEPFDAVLSDVFTVQSGIATRVAAALDVTLAKQVQQKLAARPTKNLEAYNEFLLGEKATEGLVRSDGKSLAEGEAHYARAVALDTTFGLAWGRLAHVVTSQFNVNPSEDLARRADAAVQQSMRLAPDNAQVRRAYSRYLRYVKKDYAGSLAQLDTGLLREPNNADLLAAAAAANALLSHWDAAVDAAKRAYAIDPRNANAANSVARMLHAVRRFPESDEYHAKALAISPGNISITEDRAINRVSMGDLAGAQAVTREALKTADSTELASYFALFQEMMWLLDEPLLRKITTMTPANFRNNRQQWGLKVGATWGLLGDSARARAYGDSARTGAEAQLASYPDDAQLHELHARSLALMGRRTEAIEEAEKSLKMRETALDASTGPYVRYQAARVLIQAGAYDRALDIIEPLLTVNYSDLSPGWLRLEPVFKRLKGNPRFERMAK